MTEIEFVGYSAVHPSDFIYDRRLRNTTDRINTAFFVTKLK